MLRSGVRVVAAAVLAAAAYVALPLAPASAAGCSTSDGVTAVVDFHELGGGVQTGCVAGGGGDTAASLFPAAGFSLSYVQRQPGFVCRVDGLPADSPCVNTPPADAYWALYWSDGKSGSWTYATSGVSGLRVPDGGYVALSWQGSAARSAPGFAPSPHASSTPTPDPTRTPSPSTHPSQQHSTAPSTTTTETVPSESPSASSSEAPSRKPRGKKSAEPPTVTESATAAPTDEATDDETVPTAAEPGDPDDGGLPAWVAPVVIVALFAGAGTAAVVRHRRRVPGA